MTHVFIVNETTFKTHLEYAFAGTGADDEPIDFLFSPTKKSRSPNSEQKCIDMVTDISRIRVGDFIIFFVTGISRFFGIFQAASEYFVDNNDIQNYLRDQLGKALTFRIKIRPYKVYSFGITEYDYLDSLSNIKYPDEICWSLIYRKLRANRGCSMITDSEFDHFNKLISKDNNLIEGPSFSYDKNTHSIVSVDSSKPYIGREQHIETFLVERMKEAYRNKRAFEHYLQYFVLKGIRNGRLKFDLIDPKKKVTWAGNEVGCSVGQRRIDILAIQEYENFIEFSIVELKDEKAKENVCYQIEAYIRWVEEYLAPHYLRLKKQVIIQPILLSDSIPLARNKTKQELAEVESRIINYNLTIYKKPSIEINPIKVVHFNDGNGDLLF